MSNIKNSKYVWRHPLVFLAIFLVTSQHQLIKHQKSVLRNFELYWIDSSCSHAKCKKKTRREDKSENGDKDSRQELQTNYCLLVILPKHFHSQSHSKVKNLQIQGFPHYFRELRRSWCISNLEGRWELLATRMSTCSSFSQNKKSL